MTRLDFCLAHEAAARLEAAAACEPELARRALAAQANWARVAAQAQRRPD